MPTYEYRCSNGHVVERRFKMSEAATEIECPQCGAVATRQLSGGAGLVFKGSGFYLTDYGRNAHRGTAPDTAASRAARAESGGGSSDGNAKESTGGEKAGAESKPAESKPVESKASEPKAKEAKASGSSGPSSGSAGTKSET